MDHEGEFSNYITKFVAASFTISVLIWVILTVVATFYVDPSISSYVLIVRNIICLAALCIPNIYLWKNFGLFYAFSLAWFQSFIFLFFLFMYLIAQYIAVRIL